MLAIWGAAAMVGPIVGPLIGGVATDLASWRLAFAINLPIGMLAIWAVRRLAADTNDTERERGSIDATGIVLLMLAAAWGGIFLYAKIALGEL